MRRKFLALNPRDVEGFKAQLTIQDYWTYRVWNVWIVKSQQIPEGCSRIFNESGLSALFYIMDVNQYKELLV